MLDHRLNLTLHYAVATHWDPKQARGGLATLVHDEFQPQLRAAGVHPDEPRADALFVSTTFHDDLHLVTPCDAETAPNATGRHQPPAGSKLSRCTCNSSWAEVAGRHTRAGVYLPNIGVLAPSAYGRYEGEAAAVARLVTALQRAGVRVVWMTLFARDKNVHGAA